MGLDLSGKRDDAVIRSFLFHDTGQAVADIRILDQQAHAAAELALDRSGRRSNAVFYIVFQQQIPKRQTLLIVYKQDIPAKIRISH